MEDVLRAYDWIRLAEQTREQLAGARAKLAETEGTQREQAWIAEAMELLAGDDSRESLMARARRLPALAAVRQEHAADLIGPWVDALEHLHAGIVYHAGLKSPLLEALFPHRKFEALRRANVDNAQSYGADFQRRLSSSYIERLLAREEFAFAKPSVDDAIAKLAALTSDGDEDVDAEAMLTELTATAQKVEVALQQARLLAEAALVPLPGAYEELGVRNKPKARAAKKEAAPEKEAAPKKEAAPNKQAAHKKKEAAPKKGKKKPNSTEATA